MNSNVNDPAGIAALLEQLKSSTAWQELTASTETSHENTELRTVPPAAEHPHPQASSEIVKHSTRNRPQGLPVAGSTVASLLSQLNSFPTGPDRQSPTSNDFDHGYDETGSLSTVQLQSSPSAGSTFLPGRVEPPKDRSKLTFRQALPLISELVDDACFITEINKMRSDQDALERRLWLDREAIYTKYQEKIKVAQTKAQMIGVIISQHELNMMTDALKKELSKFDLERVIPAWEGLVSRQQLELAQLNVPTMCATVDSEHLQRQQQVIQLLESLLGPKVPNPAV